jgi:hypothetical protein
MYSLSGRRRPARKRASSDPTPMNRSNNDGKLVGGEWGGKAAHLRRTLLHLARTLHRAGLRVSQGWARVRTTRYAWPLFIRDKSRMR